MIFNLNAESVATTGTIALWPFLAHALGKQGYRIWRNRSGEAISSIWMIYGLAMFINSVLYGLAFHRSLIVVNSLVLGLLQVPIVIGLWRFERWRWPEYIMATGLAMALVMAALSHQRQSWFIAFGLGGTVSLLHQTWRILESRKTGQLCVQLLLIGFLGNIFWWLYGIAVHDVGLQILCPIYLTACGLTICLWFKCQPKVYKFEHSWNHDW